MDKISKGRKEKSIQLEQLQLGVCYYPEHWDESLWEEDFRRMQELNISVIRVAEFAWSIFEPEEGVFSFEFFDRVLDKAHQHGLQVILGTPTATPPAWLTYRYPEVLNVSKEGTVFQHGARRHYNYSSPKYRELCERITRKMAEQYKDHPSVIGWQIDNELNCQIDVFYADADHAAFRKWLQEKYGTLEQLNQAWGTVFWSQTYSTWEQVHLIRPSVSNEPNPHQALDEKRFISDNVLSFARIQSEVLREVCPDHWITTNGLFDHIDNHQLTDEMLDFFSYDSYPSFSAMAPKEEGNPLLDRQWSFKLSETRSISPNFCIMEQQSGPGGWVNRIRLPSPRPGQMRLWSYQSIVHGTDLLVYFRWRTATFGTEMYWHGIYGHDNRSNRRVREVKQIGEEIAKIGPFIAGAKYQADIAIVRDYDNLWDGELDKWHGPLEWKSVSSWYKQLQYRHIPTDILYLRDQTDLEELLKYKVLIYPHPAIMSDQTAELLEQYVKHGGKILFGTRTAYKDKRGHCNMRPLPGPIAELCGVTIEEYTMIIGNVRGADVKWKGTTSDEVIKSESFNDVIHIEDASVEVVASYTSEYYKGQPALTKRAQGQGEAWYYGSVFNDSVVDELIHRLGLRSPAAQWATLPTQVELAIRSSETMDYVFLLNYGADEAEVQLNEEVKELLSGEKIKGTVQIPPYGVLVIEKTRRN